MKQEDRMNMTALDLIADGGQLQLLKLVLPCVASAHRPFLALLIKVLEIQNLMRYFQKPRALPKDSAPPSLMQLLSESEDCLPPELRAMVSRIGPMLEMLRMFSAMSDNASSQDGQAGDFSGMMGSMLSPEQMELFEKYSKMFEQSEEQKE